jgi:hypothetical protein
MATVHVLKKDRTRLYNSAVFANTAPHMRGTGSREYKVSSATSNAATIALEWSLPFCIKKVLLIAKSKINIALLLNRVHLMRTQLLL